MTNLTHKEMTSHIRNRVKAVGIKARVRMCPSAGAFGHYGIQVFPVAHDLSFTPEQAREIAFICDCNKLTLVRGMKIDLDIAEQTAGKGLSVYMPQ